MVKGRKADKSTACEEKVAFEITDDVVSKHNPNTSNKPKAKFLRKS